MRVYHSKHGQNTGSSIRLAGWPFTSNLANVDQSTFYGMNVSTQLNNQIFAIDNTTIDSYTITLPQNVNSNVKQILRTGGDGIKVESDHKYDTYYPAISTLRLNGTQVVHKVKTTNDVTYALDTDFITIPADNYNFNTSRTLASSTNRQVSMSNAATFIHKTELSTSSDYLSPMIDTKRASGVFARNLINNPTYNSENKVAANDIITIANANNIVITQLSGATGRITFTNTQDKINASSIIKGTYLNVSANNGVNAGQYRVLSVTDSGANVTVYNVSTQNVSTNSTATYTITNGRNFIAEESAYDGSAFSKYITRQFELANPCTAFKFYLDVAQPVNSTTKFYYKVSEVGDTVNLKDKEYTEISNVAISSSLGGEFNEVEKLVENLPQFDAIIFKIVFLSDDSAKISRCKNLRLIALA
jgi:hypothetical protein